MTRSTIASTKTTASTTTMPIAKQLAYLSTVPCPTIEQQPLSPKETYKNRMQAALEHAQRTLTRLSAEATTAKEATFCTEHDYSTQTALQHVRSFFSSKNLSYATG